MTLNRNNETITTPLTRDKNIALHNVEQAVSSWRRCGIASSMFTYKTGSYTEEFYAANLEQRAMTWNEIMKKSNENNSIYMNTRELQEKQCPQILKHSNQAKNWCANNGVEWNNRMKTTQYISTQENNTRDNALKSSK